MRIEIIGCVIDTVHADYSVLLGLSDGTKVRIETSFEISTPGHSPSTVDPGDGEDIGALGQALQGHTVVRAEAQDSTGTLVIALDNRAEIRVPADPGYEAWGVSSLNGALVVALPGGGIAWWGANRQKSVVP